MNFVRFMLQNHSQVLDLTLEHLWLVGISTLLAVLVGVPLGILISHRVSLSKPADMQEVTGLHAATDNVKKGSWRDEDDKIQCIVLLRSEDQTIPAVEAVKGLHPTSDMHGGTEYRVNLLRVMTERALAKAAARAGGSAR